MDCNHCQALGAEVAALRRQLSFEVDADRARIISKALKLSPQQGRLLAGLHAARGRALSRGQLCDLIPPLSGSRERDNERIVPVHIAHIRRRLGEGLIETFPGHGYGLTPAGLDAVAGACGARP
jgi:two-component system, OmpR family, response regulator QseB